MKKIIIPIAALCLLAAASCKETTTTETTTTSDTAVLKHDDEVTQEERVATNWDKVDYTSPVVRYSEISSKEVEVRGSDMYSIYSLGSNIMFTTGSASVKNEAKDMLNEVCNSIGKHYADGRVRIYGYADAVGTESDNKQLSAQRAEAVKEYMVKNCNIDEGHIEAVAMGEAQPAATNTSEAGRAENRRVRVVAMK